MAGKNKTERGFRLTWDGDDLSGDLVPGSTTGGGFVFDDAETTGVSEAVKNFLAGHADAPISAQFVVNDTQTAGVYTQSAVLFGDLENSGTLLLEWGASSAAPTGGDPTWSGTYVLVMSPAAFDAGRMVVNAEWQVNGASPPAWGTK